MIKTKQLATAQEAEPSGTPGPNDIFYQSTVYNFRVPASFQKILISGNITGTGSDSKIYVDDLAKITINGSITILNHDYSNGNSGSIHATPPVDVTNFFNQFNGKQVSIQTTFIDLYPNSNGGSAFWILIS